MARPRLATEPRTTCASQQPWSREGVVPQTVAVCLMADRFDGTADLSALCQDRTWDSRLRLKGNLVVRDGQGRTTTGHLAPARVFALENLHLTARQASTTIGVIPDPDHDQPWIIAMAAKPGDLNTLEYSARWAIEPMVSDFKSRGFGIEDSQIQHPDRLARLLLVMALALYTAVSTGRWDADPKGSEAKPIPRPPKKTPEASAQEAGSLENIVLYQRLGLHRPAHPLRSAAAASLENLN